MPTDAMITRALSGAKEFVAIAGPTGCGKSALALSLAEKLGGEIVSCDSVQVYRGFDIGSAKPTADECARVPHHLIDCCEWHEAYDAARYAAKARAVIAEIRARGRLPLVVGGTGLYLRALLGAKFHADLPGSEALREELRALPAAELLARLQSLDPQRAAALHPNDHVRLVRALELRLVTGQTAFEREQQPIADAEDWRAACLLIVLDPPRADLHARIAARTSQMLEAGLVAEVQGLLANGVDPACKPMQSIGYKQVLASLSAEQTAGADAAALRGSCAKSALPAILAATRQYAKRQTTWFKSVDPDLRLPSWSFDELGAFLREQLARRDGALASLPKGAPVKI